MAQGTELKLGSRTLAVSNLEKVLYPAVMRPTSCQRARLAPAIAAIHPSKVAQVCLARIDFKFAGDAI